jgi:hypothetical protein
MQHALRSPPPRTFHLARSTLSWMQALCTACPGTTSTSLFLSWLLFRLRNVLVRMGDLCVAPVAPGFACSCSRPTIDSCCLTMCTATATEAVQVQVVHSSRFGPAFPLTCKSALAQIALAVQQGSMQASTAVQQRIAALYGLSRSPERSASTRPPKVAKSVLTQLMGSPSTSSAPRAV